MICQAGLVRSIKPAVAREAKPAGGRADKLCHDPPGELDCCRASWRAVARMLLCASFPSYLLNLGVNAAHGIELSIHHKAGVWVRLNSQLHSYRSLFTGAENSGGLG